MKALFIGGTGIISSAITKMLSETDWELYVLNRGNRNAILPENVGALKLTLMMKKCGVRVKGYGIQYQDFIGFVPYSLDVTMSL